MTGAGGISGARALCRSQRLTELSIAVDVDKRFDGFAFEILGDQLILGGLEGTRTRVRFGARVLVNRRVPAIALEMTL